MRVYQRLASLVNAYHNCVKAKNDEWMANHKARILEIMENTAPCGTHIDLDKSTGERLVFYMSYHHMDGESGMYDGWSEFVLIVKGSLQFGFDMKFIGRDRNDTKDYLYQVYEPWLNEEEKSE